MLEPKKTRYRKYFKIRVKGQSDNPQILYGQFGIKSLERKTLSSRLLEACRRKLTASLNRQGRVFFRVFPDLPVTKKPSEVRMGKGKGSVDAFVCKIQPGQILFELDGVQKNQALNAFRTMKKKIGINIQFIYDPNTI